MRKILTSNNPKKSSRLSFQAKCLPSANNFIFILFHFETKNMRPNDVNNVDNILHKRTLYPFYRHFIYHLLPSFFVNGSNAANKTMLFSAHRPQNDPAFRWKKRGVIFRNSDHTWYLCYLCIRVGGLQADMNTDKKVIYTPLCCRQYSLIICLIRAS